MFRFLAVVGFIAAAVSAGLLPRSINETLPITPKLEGNIIGGLETTIEAVPYQISLQLANRHFCGGSIISKHWVVTAAHCLDLNHYTVRAGTANKAKGGSIHTVDKIIIHENFGVNENRTITHDIGLIRVAEPFEFDATRKRIQLYKQGEETKEGSMSVITGWGTTENGSTSILNLVQVPIISKAKCRELYSSSGGIAEGQICAAYEKGSKDSCQGDSGGPLTVDGRLAGVVSWGRGCAEAGHPGVYTEIAYYNAWIKKSSSAVRHINSYILIAVTLFFGIIKF